MGGSRPPRVLGLEHGPPAEEIPVVHGGEDVNNDVVLAYLHDRGLAAPLVPRQSGTPVQRQSATHPPVAPPFCSRLSQARSRRRRWPERPGFTETWAERTIRGRCNRKPRRNVWLQHADCRAALGSDCRATLFRKTKGILRTRPIYHSSDAAIRGHVFCSFLALVLQKELDERCRATSFTPEWDDVLRDLDRLQEVTLAKDDQQITLRTPATGTVGALFKAAGIALPPNIRDAAAG